MQKKIKDLTLEEIKKICGNNICNYCPFDLDALYCKCDDLEHYGEEEIEVDADEEESNNN